MSGSVIRRDRAPAEHSEVEHCCVCHREAAKGPLTLLCTLRRKVKARVGRLFAVVSVMRKEPLEKAL